MWAFANTYMYALQCPSPDLSLPMQRKVFFFSRNLKSQQIFMTSMLVFNPLTSGGFWWFLWQHAKLASKASYSCRGRSWSLPYYLVCQPLIHWTSLLPKSEPCGCGPPGYGCTQSDNAPTFANNDMNIYKKNASTLHFPDIIVLLTTMRLLYIYTMTIWNTKYGVYWYFIYTTCVPFFKYNRLIPVSDHAVAAWPSSKAFLVAIDTIHVC